MKAILYSICSGSEGHKISLANLLTQKLNLSFEISLKNRKGKEKETSPPKDEAGKEAKKNWDCKCTYIRMNIHRYSSPTCQINYPNNNLSRFEIDWLFVINDIAKIFCAFLSS